MEVEEQLRFCRPGMRRWLCITTIAAGHPKRETMAIVQVSSGLPQVHDDAVTTAAVMVGAAVEGPGLRVAVDGSWNPTTRRMGCGAVLRNDNGEWISGVAVSTVNGNTFLA